MNRTRGRGVRIDTLDDLDRRLARGARRLSGWRVHGLDLRERSAALAGCRVSGATFLGCTFADGDLARVQAAGALVLPVLPASGEVPGHEALPYGHAYAEVEVGDDRQYPARTTRAQIRAKIAKRIEHKDSKSVTIKV